MALLDELLATITIQNVDDITAALLDRITAVRKAAVIDDATLRAQIGARVTSLRAAAATTTTDQATAVAAATAETTRAASVKASTPAASLAYVTAIRDEVAAIHTMLAEIYSWRAQIDAGYALAVTSTADLATVVATKL